MVEIGNVAYWLIGRRASVCNVSKVHKVHKVHAKNCLRPRASPYGWKVHDGTFPGLPPMHCFGVNFMNFVDKSSTYAELYHSLIELDATN